MSTRVSRWVRIVVVCSTLAVLAVGVVALRDMRSMVGRPWPGFGTLPNGEVGPPLLTPTRLRDTPGLPRFQDRVVTVDGDPVDAPGALLRRLATVPAGDSATYVIHARNGSVDSRRLPVPRFTRGDLEELYLPIFAGATVGLLLGILPVLARPGVLATRLFFLFNLGLTLNFGYLSFDYFTLHRFTPWGIIGGWLTTSTLMHFALLIPAPLPVARRFPRLLPPALYAVNALVWVFWAVALYRSPSALRVADVAEMALFLVGAVVLVGNLVRTARNATDPAARRLARVLGTSIAIAATLGGTLFAGSLIADVRLPAAVHLLPFWCLGLVFTWAMAAHNLFELDAMVRRGLTAALVTVAALALQAAAFLAARPFVDPITAWAGTSVAAVALIAVATVVARAPAGLEAFVERTFFPRFHAARTVVRQAGRDLVRRRDETEIAEVLREALGRSLTAASVRLVAGAQGESLVEIAPPAGATPLELRTSDPLHGFAIAAHASARDGLGTTERGRRRAALARAVELDVHLVVPLPAGHAIRGALLLGPRTDGRLYTRDDEALAETLAAQAAVALEHAHAWRTVQDLERRLRAENLYLREEVESRAAAGGEMIGRSPALGSVLVQVDRIAPTDASVLVLGETGTGKELLVRAIHARSPRRDGVLVRVACAALPEPLLESELFGHERGAFTGAVAAKPGRLEVADGGTLFLDDVDTLPLGVQAKLLRALQEGEIQRLGSNRLRHVDVRVVAATNRDLLAEVRAGRFREDLYYRLNVLPLRLPPLRDRAEDIPALVEHFVRQDGPRLNPAVRAVSAEALAALAAYPWPGNIRELRNVVQRALVLARDEVLRLPGPLAAGAEGNDGPVDALAGGALADQLRDLKIRLIRAALDRAGGNQRVAAEALGIHRQSLTRMIRDLGLQEPETTPPSGGKPTRVRVGGPNAFDT